MSVVDDLLANPGLYVGVDREVGGSVVAPARMVVTPLPGRSGVSLDYEIFNPGDLGRPILGHAEHTIVARAHGGAAIMVIADTHAGSVTIFQEVDTGVFEPGQYGSPYPMKVLLAVPEAGRIRHHWWYEQPVRPPPPATWLNDIAQ